jgi:hypothetical protein
MHYAMRDGPPTSKRARLVGSPGSSGPFKAITLRIHDDPSVAEGCPAAGAKGIVLE